MHAEASTFGRILLFLQNILIFGHILFLKVLLIV